MYDVANTGSLTTLKWAREVMEVYDQFELKQKKFAVTELTDKMRHQGLMYSNTKPAMAYSLMDYPLPALGMALSAAY